MNELGKILLILGAALAAAGIFLMTGGKLPFFGKLPGDILIRKENFTFCFPLTTGIIVSVILSALLYLFTRK